MKKSLSLLAVCIILFSGCKYEYGSFSLRTKKGRVANDWKVDKVLLNGTDATSSLGNFYIDFTKDGDVEYTTILQGSEGDSLVTQDGVWEFDNRAEDLVVLLSDNSGVTETFVWEILKLQKDELWVRDSDTANVIEYYFEPR